MKKTFAVLGAGMQGTAAAYDLARFAHPERILLGDVDEQHAARNAWRVNDLVGSAVCEAVRVDALDEAQLAEFLGPVDVVLSCVPYWMHPKIAKVAIATKTNMVDLGGNTEITMQTLHLDDSAKAADVTLVPDTGLAPGLVNNIGCYFIENLDSVKSIKLYCGVLPANPQPPFNYKLTFNIEGLVTEYDFQAVTLRNGKICLVDTLDELETLHIDQLGEMEAFTTSGGTSTAPYTFEGTVENYEYKTIRYPGHCERIRIFRDFGFWNEQEVEIDGCRVVPRKLFYKVFGEALGAIKDQDLCAVRGVGVGIKNGVEKRLQVDIFDREDPTTGFTSMERLTGFSSAIYAEQISCGNVKPGCIRYEKALAGTLVLQKLAERGVEIKYS